MKKLFYGLGAVAAVVTPVVAVVSCGSSSEAKSSVATTYDAAKKVITVTFEGKVTFAQLKAEVDKLTIADADVATLKVVFAEKNVAANKTGELDILAADKTDIATQIAEVASLATEAWLADCFELAA